MIKLNSANTDACAKVVLYILLCDKRINTEELTLIRLTDIYIVWIIKISYFLFIHVLISFFFMNYYFK